MSMTACIWLGWPAVMLEMVQAASWGEGGRMGESAKEREEGKEGRREGGEFK